MGMAPSYGVAFRDVDSFVSNGTGKLVTQTTPVSGSFVIVAPGDGDTIKIPIGSGYSDAGTIYSDISGFRPGIDTVTSAQAFFYVRDDNDAAADRINVSLDNFSFVDNYKITAPVFVGGTLSANIVVSLNKDGRLDYMITPQGNLDFYIEYARLDVTATLGGAVTPAATVPEGGSTLLFLGIAFFGFAGFAYAKKGSLSR